MQALKNPLILQRVKFYYEGNLTFKKGKEQLDNGYIHINYIYKSDLKKGDVFGWYSPKKRVSTIRMVTKVTEKTISSKEIVCDDNIIKGYQIEQGLTFKRYRMVRFKKYDTRFLKGRTITFKRYSAGGQIALYNTKYPIVDYELLDEIIDEYNLEHVINGYPKDIKERVNEEIKLYEQLTQLEEKVKKIKSSPEK